MVPESIRGSPLSMALVSRFLTAMAMVACLWAQGPSAPTGDRIRNHFQRAQEALARKDHSLAEQEFEKILALNPALAGAHANLGIARYLQAKYDPAIRSFLRALELQPEMTNVELFLGLSRARAGRVEEAVPALSKGFWNADDDEWRLEGGLILVEAYSARRKHGKALDVVRALQKAFPKNTDVLYIAYRLHSGLGAKAVADLVRAGPDSARLHQVTAELLVSEGDFPRAVRQYRKALAVDPRLAGANRALAVAIISSNPDEAGSREAEQALERELSLNPRDPESLYQLGEIHWRRDEPDEALRRFEKAVEIHPNFVEGLVAMGKVLMAKEQVDRAAGYLIRAVEIDPENDVAHYRLAQAYRRMGRGDQAKKELEEFRRVRSAMESLGAIYRQVQRSTVTGRSLDGTEPAQ